VDPALSRSGHKHWLVPLARLWQKSPFTFPRTRRLLRHLRSDWASVDPVENPQPRRKVRSQTHVRRITLACILQHSQSFCLGGHWRQRSGSGGWWTAQEAIHASEPEPRLFRRLVHALAIRIGDCRKLPYMQAAR